MANRTMRELDNFSGVAVCWWRHGTERDGIGLQKTTDFKLYYLVKENPLDVITYIWIL